MATALDVASNDVYIRVVDVGPGLCAVVTTPEGHSMVFDAGHWNGQHCIKAVKDLITTETIDLMIMKPTGRVLSVVAAVAQK